MLQVEQLRSARLQLVDDLPRAIAEAEQTQRVVREKERHARLGVEHRTALVGLRELRRAHAGEPDEIEQRRRRVDEADHPAAADLPRDQTRRGDDQRHVDVLVVQMKRVAVVAFVLAEGFAVVAEHDPERAVLQAPRAQAAHEHAERCVAVVQRVAVPSELIAIRERPRLRRLIRVVAGDREIGDKERLTHWQRVDPSEDACDGRRLVDAEAGVVMA